MKTHTKLPGGPRAASSRRRRRLSTLALAPLVALAACSGEAPLTSSPTATGTVVATTPADTGTSTGESSTSSAAPSTSDATPMPEQTATTVKVSLNDPVLGHVVQVVQVVRNMKWPAGHPVAAQTFELVGVRVVVKAGTRYSAVLTPEQFSLKQGTTSAPFTAEFGPAYARLLPVAQRGTVQTGYLIFKIDRNTHPLVLEYHRPAYAVSTTSKSIPAAVLTAKLMD